MSDGRRSMRRRAALDVRVPFFRAAWRRALAVAFMLGWVGVELAWGNVLWALLAGGIAAYLIWEFFLSFDPRNYESADE